MRSPRVLTEEQEDYILQNFRKISLQTLRKEFKTSINVVRNVYVKHGLMPPAKPVETHPEVKSRYVKKTKCVCPRCRKKHERKLFWNGSLPARKYCRMCERYMEDSSSGNMQTQGGYNVPL